MKISKSHWVFYHLVCKALQWQIVIGISLILFVALFRDEQAKPQSMPYDNHDENENGIKTTRQRQTKRKTHWQPHENSYYYYNTPMQTIPNRQRKQCTLYLTRL